MKAQVKHETCILAYFSLGTLNYTIEFFFLILHLVKKTTDTSITYKINSE